MSDSLQPANDAEEPIPHAAGEPSADPDSDPEIEALLDFEPVPRRNKKENGWSAPMQRLFIAKLAVHGSPGKACDELGMFRSGIDKVFKSPGAESFRAAWAAAVEIAERRRADEVAAGQASTADLAMPFVDNRRKRGAPAAQQGPGPGEVLNEYGEYEDEASYRQRGEEARDSISNKLIRCRRLYLMSISREPVKRAAFEILTELPVDWAKAERLEAQADEPWRKPNMRNPDMLLTAENGWMGELAHGPDKKAELRRQLNEWRVSQGLEPI